MNKKTRLSPLPALLAALCLLPFAAGASDWSEVEIPAGGPARSIGLTNNGCIAGARPLPLEGPGYRVMHIERNRFYGHPQLVRTIEALGEKTEEQGLGLLLIGDLGQPRGGPMPSGHRSHQTGLDVDVWFNLDPALLDEADATRGNIDAPSMLVSPERGLNRLLWSWKQRAVLELAASQPGVDRIFVNPHLKKDLCEQADGDRRWLRKIRPWYRHDDHFHLRLACPEDSPSCETPEPVPPGDGCDASLEWWFQLHPPTPEIPAAKPPLPMECRAILEEP